VPPQGSPAPPCINSPFLALPEELQDLILQIVVRCCHKSGRVQTALGEALAVKITSLLTFGLLSAYYTPS